jgi:uncharacterized membrane protein YphA (DoxX/SURF4 family)
LKCGRSTYKLTWQEIAAMTGGIVVPIVLAYLVAAIDLFGGILILAGYQTA